MKENKRMQWLGSIILGGLLLCYWGLYNGYPFAYPDTGAYIYMGFNGEVPTDRPLSYGLFIRHTSMADSLFWVIYAQGILTSLTIFFILRYFLPAVGPAFFIGLILILVACTNISIYVSYLIPDLFTAVFLANFGLLLLADLTPRRRWMVGVLSWIALIMHNSHLFEGLLLVLLFAAARLLPRFRAAIPLKRLLIAGAIVLFGWLSIPGIHWMYSGKFSMQQAAPIFAMARVNEMGLLKPYLDQACAAGHSYPICAYKDALPYDFLWDPNSPSHKDGGWMAHREEYRDILWNMLTTPKYLKHFLIQAVNGAFSQFFYFRAENTGKWRENTAPYGAVQQHFNKELNIYCSSHQNHRDYYLDFSGVNTRQQYLFFGYLLLIALLLYNLRWKQLVAGDLQRYIWFCFMALAVNAAVCSTFSTVVSRYQGRIVWLPILMLLIALYTQRNTWIQAMSAKLGGLTKP